MKVYHREDETSSGSLIDNIVVTSLANCESLTFTQRIGNARTRTRMSVASLTCSWIVWQYVHWSTSPRLRWLPMGLWKIHAWVTDSASQLWAGLKWTEIRMNRFRKWSVQSRSLKRCVLLNESFATNTTLLWRFKPNNWLPDSEKKIAQKLKYP